MLIGYARVSTSDQSLDLQTDALKHAGCEKIFSDVASGATARRPGLDEALQFVRQGDTLVVWKFDRFGRSLRLFLEAIEELKQRKIYFRSLQEAIDTQTSAGKLFLHILASLSEFERDLLRERTCAGLSASRSRGRKGGRRPLLNPDQERLVKQLHSNKENPVQLIFGSMGISRSTFYRYLRKSSSKAA